MCRKNRKLRAAKLFLNKVKHMKQSLCTVELSVIVPNFGTKTTLRSFLYTML